MKSARSWLIGIFSVILALLSIYSYQSAKLPASVRDALEPSLTSDTRILGDFTEGGDITAPSNLRATSVGRTSVTLAWNASTSSVGVKGYKVYRNGVKIDFPSTTSYTDSGLLPATTYSYHVRAYDDTYLSSPSNTISVTTTESISDVKLPSKFSAKGSKSTNLAKITDPKKVKNLTFDVVSKNRIVFTDTVDLSGDKAVDLFKKLDKYVKMGKIGSVEVNSKTLSMLAKKNAIVSMFKLPFIGTPDILVNGKSDTGKIVSTVKYEKGTLTFSVKSFSKFEAVPKLEILEPKSGFLSEEANITLIGKISDPKASVSAKLNNQPLGDLKVATESGQFSKQLTLAEGNNIIEISAISDFGPPLVATVSGMFTPKQGFVLSTNQIIGIGVLIILLLAIAGGWWHYKKRKTPQTSSPDKEKSIPEQQKPD